MYKTSNLKSDKMRSYLYRFLRNIMNVFIKFPYSCLRVVLWLLLHTNFQFSGGIIFKIRIEWIEMKIFRNFPIKMNKEDGCTWITHSFGSVCVLFMIIILQPRIKIEKYKTFSHAFISFTEYVIYLGFLLLFVGNFP